MSDFERGKGYGKKKFIQRADRELKTPYNSRYFNKSIYNPDKDGKDSESETKIKVKQPQILIKTRDKTDERSLSPKRIVKDDVTSTPKEISGSSINETHSVSVKKMTKPIKLFVGGCLNTEELQEYLGDSQDFLVVGIIGPQGSGKSTIMNFLAANNINENYLRNVFKDSTETLLEEEEMKSFTDRMSTFSIQDFNNIEKFENVVFNQKSVDHVENCTNGTSGIDVFITENRVILLDCQPFLSTFTQEEFMSSDSKRFSTMSDNPNMLSISNSEEVQNLQYTAFLMSICNVVIFTQDYFLDSNYLRFLLTAEMLKPTIANSEEDYQDYYPHLFIIHNKSKLEDFVPSRFKTIQNLYKKSFCGSKLHLDSGMGMGSGKIIASLNPEVCGEPINLFLLPDYEYSEGNFYKGHPAFLELVERLRMHINCVAKYPVAHGLNNEKMWLTHSVKVWDLVEKSSFFVDYSKVTN